MTIIQDNARREHYIRAHKIAECFGGSLPEMTLLHYEAGEYLDTPFAQSRYMQFVVEGNVMLYSVFEENPIPLMANNLQVSELIGVIRLLRSDAEPLLVEALNDVYTLAFSVDQYRHQLLNDPVFLRYISVKLSEKLWYAICARHNLPLRRRVELALRDAQLGYEFSGVEAIAHTLGASKRQLLRVLKELCEDGVLEHVKKGAYKVLKKPDGEQAPRKAQT